MKRPLTPDYAHLQLDAKGWIDQDLPCLKCSYNLRGLSPDGRCPECGTAVGRSAHGDLLQFCDPMWVSQLAAGTKLIWWGLAIAILTPVVVTIFLFIIIEYEISPTTFVTLWLIGSSIVFITGIWKFTSPDPSKLDIEINIVSRQYARLCMIIAPILWLVQLFTLYVNVHQIMQISVTMVAVTVTFTAVILLFVYAQTLAQRFPDLKLVKDTRSVIRGLVIATLMVLILIAEHAHSILSGNTILLGGVFSALSCFTTIMYFFFGIWALRLVEQYTNLMKMAVELARQTWAKQSDRSEQKQ